MNDTKSQIGFEHVGLGSVLKQNQLEVPPNQRDYAWTTDEVDQLFQDFTRAIQDGDYFLGTVVTIPRSNGTLEVVDGQQRLGTVAILLAAIRDFLAERDETFLVESINNEFLTGIDRERRDRVAKLKLNIADNDLFAQIVKGNPPDASGRSGRRSNALLLDAYDAGKRHVRKLVAPLDPRDQGDELNRWVTFIEHKALVVVLRVPNDADAYRMFETLNDRGLRTSQADLIKNYLFGRANGRLSEVQSRWEYMRGALDSLREEENPVDFLRYALIALRGHLRQAEVYQAVQSLARSAQTTVTLTGTLENLANAYVATFNAEHERWASYPDAARRAINVLNLFNIKPARPLLLAIAEKMSSKEAAASLRLLVAAGVRLMIASNTRSGSVEVPLASTAQAVLNETVRTSSQLGTELRRLIPGDEEFREAFAVAKVSNARLARYYLRSLEMTAKEEAEPYFEPLNDSQVISLEHVLPRKPEGNWPKFDEDDVRTYSTRLGNLVLMRATENSGLKSSAFDAKRPSYRASSYVLTSQVGEVDEWTATTIGRRQNTLAELAVRTWRV